MGRVSFGASQDYSGQFAFAYNQYISEQRDLALRAERRAKEAQAAADSDMIDQWKNGDITDEEFRAYAEDRIGETAALDPQLNSYWQSILRDLDQNILTESISLKAETIMDDIQEGTATWDDLLEFYNAQRDLLNESHPLYNELTQRIGEVQDQVRQSRINGEFEEVQYGFLNNDLTGAQAGAQIRALAEKYYKVNDPETYYKLLQQAAQLEQYPGLYKDGGGTRGGGGGGGSGSGASLRYTIESLQSNRDILKSLLEQADAGQAVGQYSYVDENGVLRDVPVQLRGADGQLIPGTLNILRDSLVDSFDGLIVAYTESCNAGKVSDCSNIGATVNAKSDAIRNLIQPVNTEGAQHVMDLQWKTLMDAVTAAGNSDDPVGAWALVQDVAENLTQQQARINANFIQTTRSTVEVPGPPDAEGNPTTKTINLADVFDPAMRRDNPELNALFLNPAQLVSKDDQDQTTVQFASMAEAMAEAARQVAAGNHDEAALSAILGQFLTDDALTRAVNNLVLAGDIVTGVANGSRVPVYTFNPGSGAYEMAWLPVVSRPKSQIDENGNIVTGQEQVIIGADGQVLGAASDLAKVLIQQGNGGTPAYTLPQSVYYGQQPDGSWAEISKADYDSAMAKSVSGTGYGTSQNPPKVTSATSIMVTQPDGTTIAWLQDDTGRWHKGFIRQDANGQPIGGLPAPFIGNDPRVAQRLANRTGLDVVRDATGAEHRPDPNATTGSYYTIGMAQQAASQTLAGDDDSRRNRWYEQGQRQARAEALAARRATTGTGFQPGLSAADSAADPLTNSLLAAAQKLISAPPLPSSRSGLLSGPDIGSTLIPPPVYTPPPLPQVFTPPPPRLQTIQSVAGPTTAITSSRVAPGGTSQIGGTLE